ncbi:hypothetical protein ACLMJK_002467 [Lecanora helva]
MATSQPTSFPIPGSDMQAYTTPPNSQPYPQQFPPKYSQPLAPQYPAQYNQMYSSAQPSVTSSPTSPPNLFDLPLANRQPRQPKSPLYVPAALRPTERQHRTPLTPPRSVHGSTDSLDNSADPNRPISRRSTDSKRKGILRRTNVADPSPPAVTIPTDDLPTVTGPPTRSHWKPDSTSPICDAPVCQKRFGIFERRHHCRHCGNVFCGEHSIWQIPLDQDAEYHPGGAQVRSCGHCWGQYGQWVEERRERKERKERGEGDDEEEDSKTTPVKAVLPRGGSGKVQEGRGSLAQSLTRDWNWSTF